MEAIPSYPLTSQLKTEIMHNAAAILRQQAQATDDVGIENLNQVIDTKEGAMSNILHAGKFPQGRFGFSSSFD